MHYIVIDIIYNEDHAIKAAVMEIMKNLEMGHTYRLLPEYGTVEHHFEII